MKLRSHKIVWLSDTNRHCLAVNDEGRIFGIGNNKHGELGIGEKKKSLDKFKEISSLNEYKIKGAYAGCEHSFFITQEGKVFSCGQNKCGQLILTNGPGNENIYLPEETTISCGAKFCIAGYNLSLVFIECDPPPNTPNKPINFH